MSPTLPRGAVPPRQERSRATLHRLLDATEELLRNRAWNEITIAQIVTEAGSSVGAFYARFHSKDDLFVALLKRFHEGSRTTLAEVLDDPDWRELGLEERIAQLVARVAETCRRRRGLIRLRNQRRLADDNITGTEPERDRATVQGLSALFDGCLHEIRHPDPDEALLFALRTIDAVVVAAIAFDDISSSFGELAPEVLEKQVTGMVTGWLRGETETGD